MRCSLWIVLALALCCCGCRAVGLWLAPTEKRDLTADGRKLVERAEAEAAEQIKMMDVAVQETRAELARVKAARRMPSWIAYVLGSLFLAGGMAVGWFLKRIMGGVFLCVGGAALMGWAGFLERYPWVFWIPFGLICASFLYFLWDWWRGVRAQAALKAIVPSVEDMGESEAADLKEQIQTRAGRTLPMVKAAITAIKNQ